MHLWLLCVGECHSPSGSMLEMEKKCVWMKNFVCEKVLHKHRETCNCRVLLRIGIPSRLLREGMLNCGEGDFLKQWKVYNLVIVCFGE